MQQSHRRPRRTATLPLTLNTDGLNLEAPTDFSFPSGLCSPPPNAHTAFEFPLPGEPAKKREVDEGMELELELEEKKERVLDLTIVVPGIILTPPKPGKTYKLLESQSIPNPFIPSTPLTRPSFPSLLSFSPFSSPSKSSRRSRRTEPGTELAGLGFGMDEENLTRGDKPRRSFSLPSSINTALDWALSGNGNGTGSAPSSPTSKKGFAFSTAEKEKRLELEKTTERGYSLPLITSTGLFSPPASVTGFPSGSSALTHLPTRSKTPYVPRRRTTNRSPLIILLFPLFIITLHIYFSFVDERFMKTGRDFVFGSPLAHRHKYTSEVNLDMHDVWLKFEEKMSSSIHGREDVSDPDPEGGKGNKSREEKKALKRDTKRRFFRQREEWEEEKAGMDQGNDVVAFLKGIQDAALQGIEIH